MNSVNDLLNNITPDIYQNLKRSIELGKWPTGDRLSSEQKQLCLQAVIAYEKKNLPPEEHTGYIDTKKHKHCGSESGEITIDKDTINDADPQPLKFK